MNKIINQSIDQHINLLSNIKDDLYPLIVEASKIVLHATKNNKKIIWCGNGGSASQANHLSAELIGGMYKDKKDPFHSICLNTDTAFITAWSNDDSYKNIFVRQLKAVGEKGDILVLLSTSGNSYNIVKAAQFASIHGIKVISLTGNDGGELTRHSDITINIDSNSTQRIQEMHILVGHILCDIIETSS
jgi:D-sedoheptulose 7-phosphate isomerase